MSEDEGTPTWVKVFGSIALLVVIVLVVGKLLGLEHGASLHG